MGRVPPTRLQLGTADSGELWANIDGEVIVLADGMNPEQLEWLERHINLHRDSGYSPKCVSCGKEADFSSPLCDCGYALFPSGDLSATDKLGYGCGGFIFSLLVSIFCFTELVRVFFGPLPYLWLGWYIRLVSATLGRRGLNKLQGPNGLKVLSPIVYSLSLIHI